jgi:hypothetical protein
MTSNKKIEIFLKNLKFRLLTEMPRIQKEIKLYEERLSAGKLNTNPIPGPQFNE